VIVDKTNKNTEYPVNLLEPKLLRIRKVKKQYKISENDKNATQSSSWNGEK